MRGLLILLAVATLTLAGATSAARLPQAPACQVFPASNPWNQRVDKLPVAANSAAIVASIGENDYVHADFGSGLWEGNKIGIPITVVDKGTPRTRVSFEYASESDRGPYPIPAKVKIEGGSDRHAILVDRDACRLYELFALERRERALARRLGRDLEPRLEQAATAGLDLSGRCRAPDPPRARALRRGEARADRPRAPLHGVTDAPRVRVAGAALRELRYFAELAVHGAPSSG